MAEGNPSKQQMMNSETAMQHSGSFINNKDEECMTASSVKPNLNKRKIFYINETDDQSDIDAAVPPTNIPSFRRSPKSKNLDGNSNVNSTLDYLGRESEIMSDNSLRVVNDGHKNNNTEDTERKHGASPNENQRRNRSRKPKHRSKRTHSTERNNKKYSESNRRRNSDSGILLYYSDFKNIENGYSCQETKCHFNKNSNEIKEIPRHNRYQNVSTIPNGKYHFPVAAKEDVQKSETEISNKCARKSTSDVHHKHKVNRLNNKYSIDDRRKRLPGEVTEKYTFYHQDSIDMIDFEKNRRWKEEEDAVIAIEMNNTKQEPILSNTDKCGFAVRWCNGLFINFMEDLFARHGRRVARNPFLTIFLCVFFCTLAAVGLIEFKTELRPFNLWLPQNSDFRQILDWQNSHMPTNVRRHVAIWEGLNVLTAKSIQEMWKLHERVEAAREPKYGKAWSDVCAKVPSLTPDKNEEYDWDLETFDYDRRKRRDLDEEFDISLTLPRDIYCDMVADIRSICFETGLLEIWGWEKETIMNLTNRQVLQDLNKATISEVYGMKRNYQSFLGNAYRDDYGQIVGAEAALQIWYTEIDKNEVENRRYSVDLGNGQLVDKPGMSWEDTWVATVTSVNSSNAKTSVHPNAASSFGRVSDDNIWGDTNYLFLGSILMFVFLNISLGRFNLVEQRPVLSFFGLISVGLGILTSYGISSATGIAYAPVNSILPLLLVGLGVDDMFIIMAAWGNNSNKNNTTDSIAENNGGESGTDSEIIENAGRAMKEAGVAITATSITDVTAFAIGATTDLPALRSFCCFASFGILVVFLLQSTFFLAFVVLDEKRLRQNRNGVVWCYVHKNWTPSPCSQKETLTKIFTLFGQFIIKSSVKYSVLLVTGVLAICSIIGATQLRQEFNPAWFIPTDSYLAKFFEAHHKSFENEGAASFLFFSNETLARSLPALTEFSKELLESEHVVEVTSWFEEFQKYFHLHFDFENKSLTRDTFSEAISLFLYSPTGGPFRKDIIFDGDIECNKTAPPISYFRILFKHRPADTPSLQQETKQEIQSLLASWDLPGYEGAWSEVYSIWETNLVVGDELLRNMILAGMVIMGVTLLLLVSMRAALLVFISVTGTVVGVAATIYVSGLTIDTVSCISLVLSIGLSVDYSVHIAHSFLSERETVDKSKRVTLSLERVGPAVLQGGISSLIPFVMLAFSNSHVFRTFFVVFTSTTLLGLYYALIFLPVMLSFFGPDPYESKERELCTYEKEEKSNTAENSSWI